MRLSRAIGAARPLCLPGATIQLGASHEPWCGNHRLDLARRELKQLASTRKASRWAREDRNDPLTLGVSTIVTVLTCGFLERVTGIEPALSAWESDRSRPLTALIWASDAPLVTVTDPMRPGLMARQWPSA